MDRHRKGLQKYLPSWKADGLMIKTNTAWFKKMDSISYVYIPWTKHGMWMAYITFERGGPKIPPLERSPSAQPCSSVSWEQNGYYAARFLNESLPQRWTVRVGKEDLALQFWPPRSPDLTPCDFFSWGFVKEAVYVPSLPTTLDDLKNHITTAVNSVTQGILLRVWNEFSYRLDVTLAARGGHIEHF